MILKLSIFTVVAFLYSNLLFASQVLHTDSIDKIISTHSTSSIEDLREGYVHINGVRVDSEKTIIEDGAQILVILKNGSIRKASYSIDMAIGGDMGGGGK